MDEADTDIAHPRRRAAAALPRSASATTSSARWTGLSDYDVRRPMTPTGTSLLGLVKHVASVELGYFGDCVGRRRASTSRGTTRRATREGRTCTPSGRRVARDAARPLPAGRGRSPTQSVRELGLDAPATVPWWPEERRETTLGLPAGAHARRDRPPRRARRHPARGDRRPGRSRPRRASATRRTGRSSSARSRPRRTPTATPEPYSAQSLARSTPLRPQRVRRLGPLPGPAAGGGELAVEVPGLAQVVGGVPDAGAEPGHERRTEGGGLHDLGSLHRVRRAGRPGTGTAGRWRPRHRRPSARSARSASCR